MQKTARSMKKWNAAISPSRAYSTDAGLLCLEK